MTTATLRARLAAAFWIAAAIAAIAVLDGLRMNYDQKIAPFVVSGRIGENVAGRAFSVRVDAIELAAAVTAKDDSQSIATQTLTSAAVWVVVHLHLDARHDPITLATAVLRSADGYDYAAAGPRVEGLGKLPYARRLLNLRTTAPGLGSDGLLLFEVPRARIAGLHLRASQAPAGAPLDSLAEIDLGIDAAKASELLGQVAPVVTVQ